METATPPQIGDDVATALDIALSTLSLIDTAFITLVAEIDKLEGLCISESAQAAKDRAKTMARIDALNGD